MMKQTKDGLIFAKNSDRDANEAQIVEWHPAKKYRFGEQVQATYIEIPQVGQTNAVMISRPWWMFGAEMGTNEHGVTIGNEAVFTNQGYEGEPGLLGMDLLRLALERANSAERAVETIVSLLEEYGQVGSCSIDNPAFTYHNSFLIADKSEAYILETAAKHYAVEKISSASRSISNGLTIPGFAEKFSDPVQPRLNMCRVRRHVTESGMATANGVPEVMKLLASHGTEPFPKFSPINGGMRGPNMVAGGLFASGQTVNSWVSELNDTPQHWTTGSADPAVSLFLPIGFDKPFDFGSPTQTVDQSTWWWFSETLHRLVLRNYERSIQLIGPDLKQLQRRILNEKLSTEEAFSLAKAFKHSAIERLRAADFPDNRPGWFRNSWRKFNRAAQEDRGHTPVAVHS